MESFKLLKHRKEQSGYTIFSIDDESMQITATKEIAAGFKEERIRSEFDPTRCKYIIIDYPYLTSEGRQQSKLVLLTWAPDTAPTRQKFLFAQCKAKLKKAFEGISYDLQVQDDDDYDHALVQQRLARR